MAKKKTQEPSKPVVHLHVKFTNENVRACDTDILQATETDVVMGNDKDRDKLIAAEEAGTICPMCHKCLTWHRVGFEHGQNMMVKQMKEAAQKLANQIAGHIAPDDDEDIPEGHFPAPTSNMSN